MAALPTINGRHSDRPPMDIPAARPTSTGRRAVPKSAGATSVARRFRHSEVAMTSTWQQYENQTQRPSSSHVTPRDAPTERRTERLKDPQNAFQGESRDEVQQLRDENATFRHENDLLRTKLVEKMRGQSKVVAGGQYRAASASTVARVPVAPSSVCTKCSTARTKAIKAHQESEQAQAATVELREYVAKIEASQQRLWEDRSSHVNEFVKIREKLAEKVEQCLLIEAECTKLDNQVRRLQSENDITKFTQPLVEKEVVDNATQCALQQSCDEESNADQLCEMAGLKAEVQLLNQQRDEREQDLKRISKDLEEIQMAMKLEKEKRDNETSLWHGERSEYKRRVLELEQINKTLQVSVQDLQHTHQKELQLLQRTNQEIRENVIAKEAEIQQLNKQHKTESLAVEQRQQTLVKALKVRIEQKVADVERQHALLADHSTVKKNNAAMKTHIQDLEEQLQSLISNNDLQQQTADLALIERNKLLSEGAAEQRRLSEALSTLQQEKRSLLTRISEVEAELEDRDVLMQRQKRSHDRAMERLVDSSLRLCVVAPTVNVQLNTNGATMASKMRKDKDSSLSVICRSTPQEETIKRVIENDVLPQFTSVFLQEDDNASPLADVPMTHWLQELLHDMQARIAAQLENIYSTASANGSE